MKTYTISEIVDYYLNTIGNMQNEMHFFYHYNVFEYIHDFEKVLDNIVSFNFIIVFNIIFFSPSYIQSCILYFLVNHKSCQQNFSS